MLKIVLATTALAAGMAFVKDSHVLSRTGLVGTCSSVAAPAADTAAAYQACKPGKLEGRPDLSRKSCVSQGKAGAVEVWRCPAAIDAGGAIAVPAP